jgi:hypothetical protein
MAYELSSYDVVDFGCSNGASLQFAFDVMGCKTGIGFDIDPRKVARTRELGFEAEVADLTDPTHFSGRARLAILSHFLEHVPNATMATKILGTAAKVCSEYFFVRQPWFDCDGPLAQLGLKLYWSDWHGHTNNMTSMQLYLALKRLLEKGEIHSFTIFGNIPVKHSSHEVIVPLDRPTDGQKYDPETDEPKPDTAFSFPCYREIVALVGCSPEYDSTDLFPPFKAYDTLFHVSR